MAPNRRSQHPLRREADADDARSVDKKRIEVVRAEPELPCDESRARGRCAMGWPAPPSGRARRGDRNASAFVSSCMISVPAMPEAALTSSFSQRGNSSPISTAIRDLSASTWSGSICARIGCGLSQPRTANVCPPFPIRGPLLRSAQASRVIWSRNLSFPVRDARTERLGGVV